MSEKMRSFPLRDIEKISYLRNIEKLYDCKVIFIVDKGRVVAHARWDKGNLVISKIRRENNKKIKEKNIVVGKILYEVVQPEEIPPVPELKTEGWFLFRSKNYDSHKANRKDPYWENYEGWFLAPETINGTSGLEMLLQEYPEVSQGYDTLSSHEVSENNLQMASYFDVDTFVTAEESPQFVPELKPFTLPDPKDMVKYTASFCYCGCGKFEGWRLYWTNKWVVYVPRKKESL